MCFTDARDVVYGLLEQDPLNRLNAFSVQKHKWCRGYKTDQKAYQQKGTFLSLKYLDTWILLFYRVCSDKLPP